MSTKKITILGAGITGLWQALILKRAGHQVTLIEKSEEVFAGSSSWFAGAMLAPYCEAASAEPVIQKLGLRSLTMWKENFPDMKINGTLVLAQPRDMSVLKEFARDTEGYDQITGNQIGELEPDLEERYQTGLFYPNEAHLDPRQSMQDLWRMITEAGVNIILGNAASERDHNAGDFTIDCTGLSAQSELKELRGVRGEMAVIRSNEINITRPLRLLHPRFPLYVVPWSDNRYMLGATVIEREDDGPVTLRSALDLLSTAFALHPAFGEAELLEFSTGVRPAFPDNTPKIVLKHRHIYINGLYRHGFLLGPILADLTRQYIETGSRTSELMIEY